MALNLKVRTDYSFLKSNITIDNVIKYAKDNNSKYAAIIDFNNLFASYEFYHKCLSNGITPIIGVEYNLSYNNEIYPINLMAKSELGYQNLVKITSISNRYKKEAIEIKEISLYLQDIILVLSSEDSYLASLIKENQIFEANTFLEDLRKLFKEIYLGIFRYPHVNKALLSDLKEYANANSLVCIAMQQSYHLVKNDSSILCVLDAIKDNKQVDKSMLTNGLIESYLKFDNDFKIYYEEDELNNLNKMISSIHIKINKVSFDFPNPVESNDMNVALKVKALEGLAKKGLDSKQEYIDRVNYELDVITTKGFAKYYLIVADYVNYAKKNSIPVGPARGSGAASLVAYALSITEVDPIKNGLLFERFLNPYRTGYPDFDMDFSDILREDVITYVKEKYGARKVAHIATFATFGVKSAIRDVGRVLKINPDDIDYLLKYISSDVSSISEEYAKNESFRNIIDIHKNLKDTITIASKLEGLKKQVGLHAAGIIISRDNLDELVPTFENLEDSLVIQYDYVTCEALGLIKMDFLGLKNLTIIDYAISRINEIEHTNYTINNYFYDDKIAYDLISSGNNIGIFQLESKGINEVITSLKPNCFEDIVALIALYRPGPMDNIPTYINRKYGLEEVSYISPMLEEILKPTYGIIIYQEQIMQIVQKVANYSLAEADIFRKAISKKKDELIKKEAIKFRDGCLANGISIEKARELYKLIEKFSEYGFNKGHSVGYSIITCMTAYIKAKYPALFYEALLNVGQEGQEKKKAIFKEAKKLNVTIKYPSINESSLTYSSESNTLIFGLTNIASIKDNIANTIIEERSKGLFTDYFDFVIRMVKNNVSMQTISDLILSGALDELGIRSKLYANLASYYKLASLYIGFDYTPMDYLLEKFDYMAKPSLIKDDVDTDFAKKEYELLGIYITKHPLRALKEVLIDNIDDIDKITSEGYYKILVKIIGLENRTSKAKKSFVQIECEDDTMQIKARSYNDLEIIKNYKKNDIVIMKVSYKNGFYFVDEMKKCEVAL